MRLILTVIFLLMAHIAQSSDYIVRTKETGFYQLSTTDIQQLNANQAQNLSLESAAGERPFFFSTGKSSFNNNDNLVFFAEALTGTDTKQHPHDDDNGFKLSTADIGTHKADWFYADSAIAALPNCENIYSQQHYEANKFLIRISQKEHKETPELWYWEKLTHLYKQGFSVPLDLSTHNGHSDLALTVAFRSRNVDKLAVNNTHHHEVQVLLNGVLIDALKWDDKIQFISEKIILPKDVLKAENNTITFKIPKRKVDKKTLIDISMLDYFRLDFAIDPTKITASDRLSSDTHCQVKLNKDQFAYSPTDKKFAFAHIELKPSSQVYIGDYAHILQPGINPYSGFKQDLSSTEYLMITHPLFRETLEKLAEFYTAKGIKTSIIDTEQIYQEYSYGVRELHSIKDLIRHAHAQSNGKLKYVLLAGDSSWDWRDNGKNNKYDNWASNRLLDDSNFTLFPHQQSYTDALINRDFIPTGQYHSSEGHSASDNWFVSIIDEDKQMDEDFMPDLAIGRFPVSTPQELQDMIEKTINYTRNNTVGPWKSRVLWITNANKTYQSRSINTGIKLGDYGMSANNVFPKEMDGDNLKVQETLSNSFDQGNLIVHFIGHGGKSIWRIGPPDLGQNRDLFTLDNISSLNNANALPFVMSMSCYSAPFDHPFADSIGEKFIRQPKVGAIAVLASSWRNTPNDSFSSYILETLFKNPELSIGQAILAGKRHFKGRTMIEMYNLLGDPALHLAIPSLNMHSVLTANTVQTSIESKSFKGKAKIELIDSDNNILSTDEIVVNSTTFKHSFDSLPAQCHQGRIYAWDSLQNIDAMSSFSCTTAKVE